MSNVTDLQKVKQQREVMTLLDEYIQGAELLAKEQIGNVMKADLPDRLTGALSAMLFHAKLIMHHKGGDVATQGGLFMCDASQLEKAARGQKYHVNETPSLNTVRFNFDDNYYYDVILSDDVSDQQRHSMICELAEEAINNVFIEQVRSEMMGMGRSEPPHWLTGPLKTGALRSLLNISERCEQARWENDELSSSKVSPDALVEYASKTLFDLYAEPKANKIVVSFADHAMTRILITVPSYMPRTTFDEAVSNVGQEGYDNLRTVNESRPFDPDASRKMAEANALVAAMIGADHELDNYIKQHGRTPDAPNREVPDNVTPMRRR